MSPRISTHDDPNLYRKIDPTHGKAAADKAIERKEQIIHTLRRKGLGRYLKYFL